MATPRKMRNLKKVHDAIMNVFATDLHPNIVSHANATLGFFADGITIYDAPEAVRFKWKLYCEELMDLDKMWNFDEDTREALSDIIKDDLNPMYY